MKKWYDGMTAAKMLKNKTREWTETGDYTNGRRGPCGELGWTKKYVEIEGVTYELTYGMGGFPILDEK